MSATKSIGKDLKLSDDTCIAYCLGEGRFAQVYAINSKATSTTKELPSPHPYFLRSRSIDDKQRCATKIHTPNKERDERAVSSGTSCGSAPTTGRCQVRPRPVIQRKREILQAPCSPQRIAMKLVGGHEKKFQIDPRQYGRNEVSVLRKCNNKSPFIVSFFFSARVHFNDRWYVGIFTEIVEGSTLSDWIVCHQRSDKFIEERHVKMAFQQLLQALKFLHTERRIVHRDIKPENIGLTTRWPDELKPGAPWVKLLDFGLSLQTPLDQQLDIMTQMDQPGRIDVVSIAAAATVATSKRVTRSSVRGHYQDYYLPAGLPPVYDSFVNTDFDWCATWNLKQGSDSFIEKTYDHYRRVGETRNGAVKDDDLKGLSPCGTPLYQPVEILEAFIFGTEVVANTAQDFRCIMYAGDVWSAGMSVVQMISNGHPLSEEKELSPLIHTLRTKHVFSSFWRFKDHQLVTAIRMSLLVNSFCRPSAKALLHCLADQDE